MNCIITFIIGAAVGIVVEYLIMKRRHTIQTKELSDKLSSITITSANKLTDAYDKIEKLTKDNKILVKQLSNKDSK